MRARVLGARRRDGRAQKGLVRVTVLVRLCVGLSAHAGLCSVLMCECACARARARGRACACVRVRAVCACVARGCGPSLDRPRPSALEA